MTEEEAKEYLKETLEEIEENHKNGELILVQKPTTKELKEAIEVVLKELGKKDKAIEYIKDSKNTRYYEQKIPHYRNRVIIRKCIYNDNNELLNILKGE